MSSLAPSSNQVTISDTNNQPPTFDINSSDDNRSNMTHLREQLRSFEAPLRRHQFDPSALRVRDGQLDIGDQRLELDEDGRTQLFRQIKAPSTYLSQLDAPLAEACVNSQLERNDHIPNWPKDTRKRDQQLIAYARENKFLGFGRADLVSLTGTEVYDAVADAIADSCLSENMKGRFTTNSNESWQLDLVSNDRSIEVRTGDVIESGLRIEHCPFGTSATTIQAYFLRLVCQNGLTHRECVSSGPPRVRRLPKKDYQSKDKVLDQIRRLSSSSIKGLQQKLESVRSLAEDRISAGTGSSGRQESQEHFLNRLLARVPRLRSRRLIKSLVDAWEDGDLSAYGALNAMTYVATHNTSGRVTPSVRVALERLAGILATRSIHICPQCYSMI